MVAALTTAASVRVGGGLHPLPSGTVTGVPCDVAAARDSGALTEESLRRIAAEPSLEPLPPLREDVSVGRLVRDRLGNEIVDRLVEPLLGGVYAGRVDQLSLRATIPALAAALASGGSLVAAGRSVLAQSARTSAPGPVFGSLPGGVGRLPRALAESGAFSVRTGVTVRAIRSSPGGFVLQCGAVPSAELIAADAVVVATPAAKAARLLREVCPIAAIELAQIESASMAVVTLAYRDVALPEGSGLLVGAREGFAVKGVTFSTQKWPMHTDGLVLVRASVGRAGEQRQLQRPDDELTTLVRRELAGLIGVTAAPVDTRVTRWGAGLPQYAVGHVARVARVRAAVADVPGLAVCGAAFDGVGIPACIASARTAAAGLFAGRLGD